jgi:hypothetical protein
MKKSLLLLTSLLITTNSFAAELYYFDDIKKAVMTGKNIHIAIDFSKCTSSSMTAQFAYTQSMNMAVFTPDAILASDTRIATSLKHFTMDNPRIRRPVYEYVRYTISNNNTVSLTGQVLDAATYTPLSALSYTSCELGTAAKIYS